MKTFAEINGTIAAGSKLRLNVNKGGGRIVPGKMKFKLHCTYSKYINDTSFDDDQFRFVEN